MRAKKIKNAAHINTEYSIPQLKKMLAQSQEEIEHLRLIISKLESKLGSSPSRGGDDSLARDENDEDYSLQMHLEEARAIIAQLVLFCTCFKFN